MLLEGIRKAAFIGAHTDDEMVCAGTLHRLVELGAQVQVVTFSCAGSVQDRAGYQGHHQQALDEWHQSLDLLDVAMEDRFYLEYEPSPSLRGRGQEVCQAIYQYCEQHKPDLVITLSPDDAHVEHRVVATEAEGVLRGRAPILLRCHYPWNYSVGRPNVYVKLEAEDLEVKRAVINAYLSQKFRYDYEGIFMAQVIVDGLSVKAPAAEKFELVRGVF